MLLTRKAAGQAVPQGRLARNISVRTMDRRTFLKRSGVGAGGLVGPHEDDGNEGRRDEAAHEHGPSGEQSALTAPIGKGQRGLEGGSVGVYGGISSTFSHDSPSRSFGRGMSVLW